MSAGSTDCTINTRVLLKDLISTPAKAESLLGQLTPDQILAIEDTIIRIKRRKLDKKDDNDDMILDVLPTPAPSPGPLSPPVSEHADHDTNTNTPATATATTAAIAIATALASAMSSAAAAAAVAATSSSSSNDPQAIAPSTTTNNEHHDPVAEIRDGVEWVSFVYSHNRTLRRYNIRTDLHTVSLDDIDASFKEENCVYPRANLPKDQYRGNRWNYETDCNVLGWKLAWLNATEISGKRGLIQRAVDSYRNRYPSMRSRRVARQEKLMNGTLRKRKNRDETTELMVTSPHSSPSAALAAAAAAATLVGTTSCSASTTATAISATATKQLSPLSTLTAAIVKPANHPKTIVLDEQPGGARVRIKINVETINLDEIPLEFRKANCVFPRAINMYAGARWLEESLCNELGWRLAWLNQRQLAGKKNMLQRALDVYRTRFIPTLQPRKHAARTPSVVPFISQTTTTTTTNTNVSAPSASSTTNAIKTVPLTAAALSAQNAWYEQQESKQQQHNGSEATTPIVKGSPAPSCASGTTITLDFGDCLSLAAGDDEGELSKEEDGCCDMLLCSCADELSTIMSNSSACTPSPTDTTNFFGGAMPPEIDLYDSFMLPPSSDMSLFAEKTTPSSKKQATTISSALGEITRLIIPPAPQDLTNSMLLASPSLPSSAVQQQDLVVKMENEDMILLPSEFLPMDCERLFDLF